MYLPFVNYNFRKEEFVEMEGFDTAFSGGAEGMGGGGGGYSVAISNSLMKETSE